MEHGLEDYVLISKKSLDEMMQKISILDKVNKSNKKFAIYSNKQIIALLHINDKLIRKYREQGLIGYIKVGDKYWYSNDDVEEFLKSNHHQAFV